MLLTSRLCHIAVLLAFWSSAALAQMAPGFPSSSVVLFVMTARSIAQCEVQNKQFAGETEKFLLAVESTTPGLLMGQKRSDVSNRFLTGESYEKLNETNVSCQAVIAAAKPMLSTIACYAENDTALSRNSDMHSKLSMQWLDHHQGEPCLGMCVGRPGERGLVQASCKAPSLKFETHCIEPGGPADQAGIKTGDEMVSMNGVLIRYPLDFEVALLQTKPGQQARIVTKNANKQSTHLLTLGISRYKGFERGSCERE
jgi:PDZ domain